MKLVKPIIIISLLSVLVLGVLEFNRSGSEKINEQIKQQQIGVMIQQLQVAIKSPQDKKSLSVISKYGTDSRYYVMIRGWLVQEMIGVKSQLDVQQDQQKSAEIQIQYNFLKQAIRSIDLE